MKRILTTSSILALSMLSASSFAVTPLQDVQSKWAVCQYQVEDEDQKIKCLENLIMHNTAMLQQMPDNPELTVWLAINKALATGLWRRRKSGRNVEKSVRDQPKRH